MACNGPEGGGAQRGVCQRKRVPSSAWTQVSEPGLAICSSNGDVVLLQLSFPLLLPVVCSRSSPASCATACQLSVTRLLGISGACNALFSSSSSYLAARQVDAASFRPRLVRPRVNKPAAIMIAKLASPLASPTLAATTAQLRNRLPTQLRRCLPIYIAGIVVGLFLLNMSAFSSSVAHHVIVRPTASAPLDAAGSDAIIPKYTRHEFPRKIWQTWKVHPFAFDDRDRDNAKSWPDKNPEYRYEVLTDRNEMEFLDSRYGPDGFNRPDILDFYRAVKAAIVKADLLRYLIMYAEGGVYADIDVESIKPISKAVPDRYDVKDIDMVVGVEIDEPDWKDHSILGPKSRSFCQWTFVAKPQLPVMMRLIEQVMAWMTDVAQKQNSTVADVELDFDQIITGTGPSAFTKAIMDEMNANRGANKEVTWDDFHYMTESKLVSRVLVLTVEAFAAGQGHSSSASHESRTALIKHHYHASNWPSRHPRYKHPAYGQVEDCNWADDCVRKWDKDVEAFSKMTPEEQSKVVGEKEAERKAEEEKKERADKEEEERKKKDEAKKKLEEARKTVAEAEKAEKAEAEAERKAKEAPPEEKHRDEEAKKP